MTVMMGIKQKWNKLCRAIPDNRLVSLAVTTVINANDRYNACSVIIILLLVLIVLYYSYCDVLNAIGAFAILSILPTPAIDWPV